MDLSVGEDDWDVTPHGRFMGDVLARPEARELVEDREVLELGAGVGNHTIVILRQGAARVVATEIHPDLMDTARENVEANCPEAEGRTEFRVADWLNTEGEFDVVVTNPPFCKSGKQNRRYFIDSLILDAHKRLKPGGDLLFVQSSMADLSLTLRALQRNGFDAEVLDTHRGPFRDYYFEDETFMEEIRKVEGGFEVVDGVHYEKLHVVRATLRPFTPPEGAHIV